MPGDRRRQQPPPAARSARPWPRPPDIIAQTRTLAAPGNPQKPNTTEVDELISRLLEHKIGALPVVEPGTRERLGIISYVNVLRALQDLLEEA